MFQFLDDENLTDNDRSDIDRILYHPKEISKCEFPDELGYSFVDETVKNVGCNVANAIDTTSPLSSASEQHQNHNNGNVVEQQLANMNLNTATISLAYGNTSLPNYIQLPMTSQNYATAPPILSQAGSPYLQQAINTSALRGGVSLIPYTLIPANFNLATGRFVMPPPGQMPPPHYPAAVFYPSLIQTQDVGAAVAAATAAASQPPTNTETAAAGEETSNTDELSTAVIGGVKTIDNNNVDNNDDGNSQMPHTDDDEQHQTQTNELRTTTNDNVNIDFVNTNNNSSSSSNENVTDVPIIVSSTSNAADVLPNSTMVNNVVAAAHSRQFDESSNCQTDTTTPSVVKNTTGEENDGKIVLSMVDQTGRNEKDVEKNDKNNVSVVANGEIVAEKSQSPDGVVSTTTTTTDEDNSNATGAGVAPAAKSWASLFKNTAAANNAIVINKFGDEKTINDGLASNDSMVSGGGVGGATHSSAYYSSAGDFNVAVTSVERDPPAQKLGKELKLYTLQHRGPIFQLRGLNNYGNWCYVNATLQALMACPPFVHLLRKLNFMDRRTPSSTPMLDAFVKFVGEFPDRYLRKSSSQELDKGTSFEPKYIYTVLSSLKDDTSFKGRQEDAEEFLTLVLNHLHEEMAACLTYASDNNNVQNGDAHPVRSAAGVVSDDEWQQVLPGKKSAITTRSAKLSPSPMVDIFSGVLRNTFQQHGSKDSASSESFFTLQLSIQSPEVNSVNSALLHMGKEIMKNVTTPSKNTKVEVDITRRTTFQELPIVLILHLKYFIFVDEVVKKLIKPISYGMDLQIDRNLAPPVASNMKFEKFSRSYKLFAVVFHHGEQAAGGHYTADIFHGGHWVNLDDSKVELVDENHVTTFQSPRVPYLLFYRRCDMFSDIRQGGN